LRIVLYKFLIFFSIGLYIDLMKLYFFSWFWPTTLNLLEVILHNFFMNLSWFHYLNYRFNELTWVDSSWFFLLPFLINFFYFIIQHKVSWKLDFVNIFYLLFMKLSRSYNLNYEFDRLTRVDSIYFSGPF
jgi:hypothetical protein